MTNHIFSALLEALQDEYGTVTQQQIAKALGVTQATISNWSSGGQPSKTNLKKLIDLFREHHAATLVKPIFEFQAIDPTPSGDSWRFSADAKLVAELKAKLENRPGLYLYYDSAGHAIYLGKTESSLYTEAKQRLKAVPNRAIFVPTKAQASQMGQLARFLSAYEVTIPAAIKNIESFMLRAFANDLLNKNGGHFKSLL
ncbi:helix-turn-helix domain-containing protein [Niveibacterium sp. COAC-50]|uniref:helix-turn-helix domain-containing protein n=1 Tax=Niveibacterium sp. COAC-50 TaxID=2729384 RepID=UPI001557D324|nr:helix-turn-helix domain-containing protein [Niveibacterium sp. COAC-50]